MSPGVLWIRFAAAKLLTVGHLDRHRRPNKHSQFPSSCSSPPAPEFSSRQRAAVYDGACASKLSLAIGWPREHGGLDVSATAGHQLGIGQIGATNGRLLQVSAGQHLFA